jgi:hypothetical protein
MTIVNKRVSRIFECSRLPVCPLIAVLTENSAARAKDTRPATPIAVTYLSFISELTVDTINYTHGNQTTIA